MTAECLVRGGGSPRVLLNPTGYGLFDRPTFTVVCIHDAGTFKGCGRHVAGI